MCVNINDLIHVSNLVGYQAHSEHASEACLLHEDGRDGVKRTGKSDDAILLGWAKLGFYSSLAV